MATKPILTGWLAYILAIVLGVSCSLAPGQGVPRLSATAPAHAIPARVTPPIPTVLQTGQNACTATLEVQIGAQLTQSETIAYLLYLPAAYGQEPAKQWPLILYLHGSGECGRDLDLLKRHPLPALLDQDPDFPFIVVSPQLTACNFSGVSESPADLAALSWAWSARAGALLALLDQLQTAYAVDEHRIYLTGISLGGFGTWQIALRYPHTFAAIVPIAGGYILQSDRLPEQLCTLKGLPVWAFHGALDANVPPAQDEVLVQALQECGGQARLTVYPDLAHNAWDRAYADPELYRWLLDQSHP